MLVEFRVENHRSIREEQVFTMEASRAVVGEDSPARQVPGHAAPLLPVAAIYGANASGKSNVLRALSFMRACVVNSQAHWQPGGGVPRDPFAWSGQSATPSMFEATFLVADVRYQYGFTVDDARVLEEWLYAWPRGRRQTWFTRDRDVFKFGEHLAGENRAVEKVTRPNALFLAAAAQLQHEQLSRPYTWFLALDTVTIPSTRGLDLRALAETRVFLAGARHYSFEPLNTLLRSADVGIAGVRVEATGDSEFPRILVDHVTGAEDVALALEEESDGTRTLVDRGRRVIAAIRTGGVLVVDELERSLHPSLARQIVEQFNDPAQNPLHAQLVFATHDSNLLALFDGKPALRRDQVWLTEKTADGATRLYPLTDFRPAKHEDLERRYLQGRYGAIPFLTDLVPPENAAHG